jgi:hypothetical protein
LPIFARFGKQNQPFEIEIGLQKYNASSIVFSATRYCRLKPYFAGCKHDQRIHPLHHTTKYGILLAGQRLTIGRRIFSFHGCHT